MSDRDRAALMKASPPGGGGLNLWGFKVETGGLPFFLPREIQGGGQNRTREPDFARLL